MTLAKPLELCITEEWIKERLDIHADTLVSVRSLLLPGTYHQKITHLGRSLLSFSRLKHLDLSRNALESLKGLDHLTLLESINLYYNNIPDLREVFRLRHNAKLKEVDLRLNPLTKHEPDYRLFTIHMLPSLRKLDDRTVSEGERKAALMHFDSDQAHGFQDSVRSSVVTPPNSPPPVNRAASRKALVNSLAPTYTGLGADTEELLELIAERDGHLLNHKPRSSPPHQHPTHTAGDQRKKNQQQSPSNKTKQHSQTRDPTTLTKFDDEYQAYTQRRPLLHFTPCPAEKQDDNEEDAEEEEEEEEEEGLIMEGASAEDFAEHVANKIQKLMVKSRSFKSDQVKGKVFECVQQWLKASQNGHQEESEEEREREEVTSLRKRLQAQTDELTELRKRVAHGQEVEELLRQAHTQLDDMRSHCQQLLEENQLLKSSDRASNERLLTQSLTDITNVKHSQKQVIDEVHKLSRTLTQHLAMANQQQELASLLQESHQCLMVAHDHILKEEEARRQQYSLEVNQLKSNYDTLRKTFGLIQTTPMH